MLESRTLAKAIAKALAKANQANWPHASATLKKSNQTPKLSIYKVFASSKITSWTTVQ